MTKTYNRNINIRVHNKACITKCLRNAITAGKVDTASNKKSEAIELYCGGPKRERTRGLSTIRSLGCWMTPRVHVKKAYSYCMAIAELTLSSAGTLSHPSADPGQYSGHVI